ncbi:hypothetical protein [Paraburkholderia fungorum]|jgi:hypothetical protein
MQTGNQRFLRGLIQPFLHHVDHEHGRPFGLQSGERALRRHWQRGSVFASSFYNERRAP